MKYRIRKITRLLTVEQLAVTDDAGVTTYINVDSTGTLLTNGSTLVQTDPSFYLGDENAPQGTNAPIPDFSFSIDAMQDDGTTLAQSDVISYACDAAPPQNNPATDPPDQNWCNFPNGDDPNTDPDPGFVEIDPTFFDDYDQYYDDAGLPVYTGDSGDSSVGIRG